MTFTLGKLLSAVVILGVAVPSFAQDTITPDTNTLVMGPVAPPSTEEKRNELQLKFGLLGESLQDPHENSNWAGGEIDVIGRRRINSWFSARMDLSAYMTSGSYTNQYTDDGKAPNLILINEAVAQVDPSKYSTFEIGVIQTNFLDLPSTFQANGFPSVRGTVHYEGDSLKISSFAMQSIPTSDTKAVQATEDGVTAGLTTVGLSATTNPKDTARLTLKGGLVHFNFTNLNASAATDSEYLGNTVVGTGGPQAHFVYGFSGNEVAASSKYRFNADWAGTLDGAFLKNDLAPDGSNIGYTYSTGVAFNVHGVEMGVTVGRFYNESDTLPGTYASLSRSFNDRFGNRIEVKAEDKKEKVSGSISYTEADAITETEVIADRGILLLSLEVAYDIL